MVPEPLSDADVEALERLPVGARIRWLRERQRLTQHGLLHELAQQPGSDKPGAEVPRSTGWLSNIEKGSLRLKVEYLPAICGALRLDPGVGRRLLDPDATVALEPDLLRYGAWQAVRLHLAAAYVTELRGKAERAVTAERWIAETLAGDAGLEQLREEGWDVTDLRRYLQRALATATPASATHHPFGRQLRWMLLVEGLYQHPYHPYGPNSWLLRRTPVFDLLASHLDVLPADRQAAEAVSLVIREDRSTSVVPSPRSRLAEPVEVPAAQPGVAAVARALLDDPALDVVAGGSVVGEYGWHYACGQYLLGIDDALQDPPPPWTPAARRRLAGREPVQPLPPTRENAARLLWAVGQDGLRNDLAKLWTMVRLAREHPRVGAGDGQVDLDPRRVREVLGALSTRLKDHLDYGERRIPEMDKELRDRIRVIDWYAKGKAHVGAAPLES